MLAVFHRHLVQTPFLPPEDTTQAERHDNAIQLGRELCKQTGLLACSNLIFEDGGCAFVDDSVQVAEADMSGFKVHCLFSGNITNINEIRELYSGMVDQPLTKAGTPDFARTLLDLYFSGYADTYGDYSDQPATLLGALEGEFTSLLYDAGMGYLLVVRSAGGGVPLFWGLDDGPQSNLVFSMKPLMHLSPFPRGCAYESQTRDSTSGSSRMLNVARHTPAQRMVSALPQVDSHGHLCSLRFKSKSGRDLTAMAPNVPDVF